MEPQCKARFLFAGRLYEDVTVSDLGAEGCCIKLPAESIRGLRVRSVLEGWVWTSPGLPGGPVSARVAWIRDHGQPRTDHISTGVSFRGAPAAYLRDLDRFVTLRSESDPPPFDLYGVPV